MYLSVVIPAYNEARRLPLTLARVLEYLNQQPWDWELLVVDDGSSDATADLAEAALAAEPRAQVLRNPHRGKGFAVRTGMLAAAGDYVLFSDADLAVPFSEWPRMEAALHQGHDVVIASREGAGARRINEPPLRHFMGRVFNLIVRMLAIGNFQDTQCGFKVFTQAAAQDVFQAMRLYTDASAEIVGPAVTAFDVEALFLALRRGYRVAEVPVEWHYGEETRVSNVRDSWRNLVDVLTIRWNALTGKYRHIGPIQPREQLK